MCSYSSLQKYKTRDYVSFKDEIQPQAKRHKISPQSSGPNVNQKKMSKTNSPYCPLLVDIDETVVRNPDRSPSVLSEIIEFAAESAIHTR